MFSSLVPPKNVQNQQQLDPASHLTVNFTLLVQRLRFSNMLPWTRAITDSWRRL